MKVKVIFDNENQRYKIYNGDTVINANEVTINEVPIDAELSDTSANAVENKVVKEALDNNIAKIKKVNQDLNQDLNTVNSRIDSIINKGYSILTGSDFSWTWDGVKGTSNDFSIAEGDMGVIFFPSVATLEIYKNNSIYISEFGNPTVTSYKNAQSYILNLSDVSKNDILRIECTIHSPVGTTLYNEVKQDVESMLSIVLNTYPLELQDIRADYFGIQHNSAGDAVRSIMDTLIKGYADFTDLIEWLNTGAPNIISANFTLPKNINIRLTIPEYTNFDVKQNLETIANIGDIATEETQEVTFNTGDNDGDIVFIINSSMTKTEVLERLNDVFKMYLPIDTQLVTIDSAMSDSSENAVQNKVIKAYVDKGYELIFDDVLSTNANNCWITADHFDREYDEVVLTFNYPSYPEGQYPQNVVSQNTNNLFVYFGNVSLVISPTNSGDISFHISAKKVSDNLYIIDWYSKQNLGPAVAEGHEMLTGSISLTTSGINILDGQGNNFINQGIVRVYAK